MVNNIHEPVNYKALSDRYVVRDGYIFSTIGHPGNVFDAIVIKYPKDVVCFPSRFPTSNRSLEEHISLIKELNIEKAIIFADNIAFLLECPSLKHLNITPSDTCGNGFDYSPLYDMPTIKSLWCATIYGKHEEFFTTVDYSRILGIEDCGVYNAGHLNYRDIKTLKTLGLSGFNEYDLKNAFSSSQLDSLMLIQCKVKSLDGLQNSPKMQCLYLYHNRSLKNIDALREVKGTLRALRIENCPKIENFSALDELENLELLELSGSNELPNLNFLKKMKTLKSFILSMNVKDGDVSLCRNISYVKVKNRKHYNLKFETFPKVSLTVRGNENIEDWRKMD